MKDEIRDGPSQNSATPTVADATPGPATSPKLRAAD
jgi:hypothetical protein